MKLNIQRAAAALPPPLIETSHPLEIWRDHAGAVYAYGEMIGEECWMHVPGLASFRFTRDDSEVAASVSDSACTEMVVDAYRRRVLPMAFQVRGYEVLHASAVRSPAGVVGLCGVSQAGKSTIAFGLSRRGYNLWCDDALAFELSEGKPQAISLPFELRLRPTAIELFGDEFAAVSRTDVNSDLPGSETAPFAALCILRRAANQEAPVTIKRLPYAKAFLASLGNACWFTFQTENDKRRVIDHYMDLVAQVPIFELTFTPGLEHLPAVLDTIEQTLVN